MLTFEGQYIGYTFLDEINQSLDCHRYEVKNDARTVGTVFASASLSLIILPDITLRVDRNRWILSKSHHKMFNNSSGALVGVFEFPDWQSASHTRCILRFMDESVYSFNQNNDHKRLLKPGTWNLFRFDMSNSENIISYFGSQLSGEIECTDDNNLLPIISGIFIIDEKFRLISEAG